MAQKIKIYHDENGAKHLLDMPNCFEDDITAEMAAIRAAKAAENQNKLYEKEIKELRRNGNIAIGTALGSLIVSIVSIVVTLKVNGLLA